jgi:hypothetical protein
MKKSKKFSRRVNHRRAFVAGFDGGLAQLGYFTPHVQRVVRKWKSRERFIKEEYFFTVAAAALWHSNTLKITAVCRAHWPMIWELAAACDKVRRIPKDHPTHWLLRMNINVQSNVRMGKIRPETRADCWGEISEEIKLRGGPDFDVVTLRQHAKRLGLVPSLV